MGPLIRLCLRYGVELWFIPQSEPWRNGVVEQFNHHYQQKFLDRVPMHTVDELREGTLVFEQKHNSRYRYSKLNGKTPLEALAQSGPSASLSAKRTSTCGTSEETQVWALSPDPIHSQ
jgi:transposase InsO family protein